MDDKLLDISKARREEIEYYKTRDLYLDKLTKAKIVMPNDLFQVAEETDDGYGVPWL